MADLLSTSSDASTKHLVIRALKKVAKKMRGHRVAMAKVAASLPAIPKTATLGRINFIYAD
jgi:hypothetical protein